ncbi:MAG: GTP 3',8-cyclase MoaA [Gammaproteobacteria bacterium]|nr:GTP 3',8-cyclase MoaA [Gammaproteobacteria bacterium]
MADDAKAVWAAAIPSRQGELRDAHGRVKRKLRLSLTDRCNLRCLYCMPEHPEWLPKAQVLRREELLRLARLFVTEMGITHLRLTGGEPLLRRDVVEIVAELDALRSLGLRRIAMTSNGALLDRFAVPLAAAGLDDLNVSLDARTPEIFHTLTRGDIEPVLRGIDAARAAGLPVKINCVAIRGHNDAELLPLAEWARTENLPLRFIEFMPLDGRGAWSPARVITEAEILAQLRQRFSIEPLPRSNEPATYYRLDGHYRLGVISTVSKPFCSSCDRVRLTATGELYACLFSPTAADLRGPLRAGADDAALAALIRRQIWFKEAGYIEHKGYVERPLTMHAMGG